MATRAQYHVGAFGDDDPQTSMEWLLKSARQGYGKAAVYIADMYHTCGGRSSKWLHIKQDDDTAIYWLRHAANRGYAEASLKLGKAYSDSFSQCGVPYSKGKALFWFRKAIGQGNKALRQGTAQAKDSIEETVREAKSRISTILDPRPPQY